MLQLKSKPLSLKLKEPEIVIEWNEQLAERSGLKETVDGVRLAKGPDWEIWIIPLNFVLKNNGTDNYYSSFIGLLHSLADHRLKYWLTQEKWTGVQQALENVDEEIRSTCEIIKDNLDVLCIRYGISRTD